ncbi:MAG: superoxide dismutase family protein [Rhodothermales bacterium]
MTLRFSRIFLVLALTGSIALLGCETDQQGDDLSTDDMTRTQETAVAQLEPTEGNDVTGTVTFTALNGSVQIEGSVMNLSPGEHGFHVHEVGDCSAPDASSAGGHFNPEGVDHGARTDDVRHVGDLGNIEAGPDGTAEFFFEDDRLALSGEHSIIGRAVVVHGGADDLTSQPSGAAGARVACGVITSS